MITIVRYLVVALLFVTSIVTAQDFQGKATYKSQRKINIELDSTQINSEMHQNMMAMLKKQFQRTHILTFNKEASLYKEDEQLEAPQPAGMQMVMVNIGGSDLLYKNIKEQRFTNQNESFSKLFLIKDKLEELDWELNNETKFIGDYKCYKATLKREVEVVTSGISVNGDKDLDTDENEEPEMREVTVVAWYTPQIPVNNGPANYHGLPGLILEVNDGSTTIICSKIVLNPEKKVTIVEPKKGKVMNQEKYDVIMDKKMQEMQERTQFNRNSDDGGQNIEIRIGG